ncbi:MAG: helix-turn-helix transcriptional regulator [Methyloceanibacter sp.]
MEVQKFLRRREVVSITGLPTSTLYEKIARGEFPRPVQISARRVAWLESEVAAWQKSIIAKRAHCLVEKSG